MQAFAAVVGGDRPGYRHALLGGGTGQSELRDAAGVFRTPPQIAVAVELGDQAAAQVTPQHCLAERRVNEPGAAATAALDGPRLLVPECRREIGRAHVCTPVTKAHLVCRTLLE